MSRSKSRAVLLALIVGASVMACREKDVRSATPDTVAIVPAVPLPVVARFAAGDLKRLKWIEGRWRGRMPNNDYFYEQYTLVDDSTIVMHAFGDPTFTRTTDSSRVVLRDGVVSNDGGSARWVATRMDSTGVDFAPERGAVNYFTWARGSANAWTASLRWTDQQGRPQNVTYSLQRLAAK